MGYQEEQRKGFGHGGSQERKLGWDTPGCPLLLLVGMAHLTLHPALTRTQMAGRGEDTPPRNKEKEVLRTHKAVAFSTRPCSPKVCQWPHQQQANIYPNDSFLELQFHCLLWIYFMGVGAVPESDGYFLLPGKLGRATQLLDVGRTDHFVIETPAGVRTRRRMCTACQVNVHQFSLPSC